MQRLEKLSGLVSKYMVALVITVAAVALILPPELGPGVIWGGACPCNNSSNVASFSAMMISICQIVILPIIFIVGGVVILHNCGDIFLLYNCADGLYNIENFLEVVIL